MSSTVLSALTDIHTQILFHPQPHKSRVRSRKATYTELSLSPPLIQPTSPLNHHEKKTFPKTQTRTLTYPPYPTENHISNTKPSATNAPNGAW